MNDETAVAKKLRKLRRIDLLELLLNERRENEALKEKIKELEEIIAAQDIEFQNAGTLAEAALKLNKIFADADAAAASYLRNIHHTVEEGGRFADETRIMAGKPETLRRRNMPGPGKRTP